MKRRDLFKGGSLAFLGSALLNPGETLASVAASKAKKAKNIIFMVSDGMSTGTLNMANLLLNRREGKTGNWLSLYEQNKVVRALMDTASASSMVTDSAAASSSWGGGKRVPNGSLNVNADGSENIPIWQKFKSTGKAVGVVTSVTATHATPAGFCVNSKKRSEEPTIAEKYLKLGIDVVMGGGLENFDQNLRKDKQDLFSLYRNKGYSVFTERMSMINSGADSGSILGIFGKDALPYSLDRSTDKELLQKVPTLAEMTKKAIASLSKHKNGFVLQVEAGKVDWAAHANDIGGLLYDQIAFDEAIGEVIAFAERDQETLVIITTDHGNANPGIFYGSKADANFARIQNFKKSNTWILNNIDKNTSKAMLIEMIEHNQGYAISGDQAAALLKHYESLDEEGIYNPRKLPFKQMAEIQREFTSVGWGSMDHSGDYVELAAFGPGSELIKPFIKNFEIHNLLLSATGVNFKS